MGLNRAALWGLDPGSYRRHELHVRPRAWPESNCYVDLCVEVLHAAACEPYACLGFSLATDFEVDQFTFFKPPPQDLQALYGVSVYELNLWRPLVDHALVQLQRGALLLAEVDSFYLPDTSATDYRRAHVKTTIGIERLDLDARSLGYFHNAGFFALEGADFDGLFHIGSGSDAQLPPYVELVRFAPERELHGRDLVARSLELTRDHLRRRPANNPITRYKAQLDQDIEWLIARDLATYHQYAFSMLRQLGASFEHAALYLGWLGAQGETGFEPAAQAFDQISQTAKTMILKLARVVNSKRAGDLSAMVEQMETSWERGMSEVIARLHP
jgi:hypothetical protein